MAVPGVRSALSSRVLPWTSSGVAPLVTVLAGTLVVPLRRVFSSLTGFWTSWVLPFTVRRASWRGKVSALRQGLVGMFPP